MCVLLIVGAILCIAVVFMTESVIPILLAFGCLFLSFGLSSPSLESDIEQIWGLQEVSSECDLPDHDLPTKNMKCYVTDKDKRIADLEEEVKELREELNNLKAA